MRILLSDIKSATVSYEGQSLTPTGVEVNGEEETLTLSLAQPLHQGHQATVLYTFTGILNDNLMGLYRSKYTVNGKQR